MNPYAALGLEATATPEDIKAAYRAKVKTVHPDTGGDADEFDQVQRAYDILSNPERRKRFDETGSTAEPSLANPDAGAWHIIAHLCELAVQSDVDDTDKDLVAEMKRAIDGAIRNIDQRIHLIEREIARAVKMHKRFKRKKAEDGLDIVANMLIARSARAADILEQVRAERRANERAKEIIDGYNYERPFPSAREYVQFGQPTKPMTTAFGY